MKTSNRLSTLVAAGVLCVLGLGLGACNGGAGGSGRGGGGAQDGDVSISSLGGGDGAGDPVADGLVQIASVDRSSVNVDGTVRYYLKNLSGRDQEDLAYYVQFMRPGANTGAIKIDFDLEVSNEKGLVLFKDAVTKEVVARSREADVASIENTRLAVYIQQPVATVARSESNTGTKFLGGLLECVKLEGLFEIPAYLEVGFENTSRQSLSDLEMQAVFIRGGSRSQTAWQALPEVGPGRAVALRVSLAGTQESHVAGGTCWIKIRQADIF